MNLRYFWLKNLLIPIPTAMGLEEVLTHRNIRSLVCRAKLDAKVGQISSPKTLFQFYDRMKPNFGERYELDECK